MAHNTKTFNVSFPKELLALVDEAAKRQFASRSDLLRTAALEYIQKEQDGAHHDGQSTHDACVSDKEAIDVANSLLERYKQDFRNLSKR